MRKQLSAVDDACEHVAAMDGFDAGFEQTVVEEESLTHGDVSVQVGVVDGDALVFGDAGCEHDCFSIFEHAARFGEIAHADFGALEILENGDGQSEVFRRFADVTQVFSMNFVGAVGEVQTTHVHARVRKLDRHLN